MTDRAHDTLASSAFGLFTGAFSWVYGAVTGSKATDAAFQLGLALAATILGVIATHYLRKLLKAIDEGGFMNAPVWAKGLLAAFIGGASNVMTLMIVDPVTFNITDWKKTLTAALVGGVLAIAMYLKSSPIPAETKV